MGASNGRAVGFGNAMLVGCPSRRLRIQHHKRSTARACKPWSLTTTTAVMGKLNIAHHKSYHPYRRDNIEKVRRDEEEARIKEAQDEGRMLLAVRLTFIAQPTTKADNEYRTLKLASSFSGKRPLSLLLPRRGDRFETIQRSWTSSL